MFNSQELCGVRICWLRPGNVCLESRLGLNEYAQRNVVAKCANAAAPTYRRLTRDEVLTAMLAGTRSFFPASAPDDPLVEMLSPVTIFQFETADLPGSHLAAAILDQSAAVLFSEHLEQLEQIGLELARRGLAVDRGRWGTFIYCTPLWIYPPSACDEEVPPRLTLAGHVDLYRFPLAMFAEQLGPGPGDSALAGARPPAASELN